MKGILFLLGCVIYLNFYTSANAQNPPVGPKVNSLSSTKNIYDVETGKRFIKLGLTYRELKDYDNSMYYLKKGLNIVKYHKNKYWEAVAYELLAYVYRDQKESNKAIIYLGKAYDIYDRIITQENGSPYAVTRIIDEIEIKENRKEKPEGPFKGEPPNKNRKQIEELLDKVKELQKQINEYSN